MQEQEGKTGLALVTDVWSRRKWLAVLLFLAPFAGAFSVIVTLPDLYSSTATVLVEQQIPEGYVKPSVTGEADTRLHLIREKLLNRTGLMELIAKFNLYPELRKRAPEESVVERMRKDITLELKELQRPVYGRDSTFGFKVSYRGRDPETVAQVTNTLAGLYVEENLQMRSRQASETVALLKKQLDEVKERHDEQERRIAAFKQRHMGELPEQIEVNLSTLARLNQELSLNSENQMRVLERKERLGRQLFEVNAGGTTVLNPDSLPYQLEKLRTELTALRTRASHKHPDVRRLEGEIAAIEKALMEMAQEAKLDPSQAAALLASPDDIKDALRDLDRDLKNLKAEEQRLRQELAAYQRRVERSPQHAQEFQQLERDYKMTRDLYVSLLQRYEDAQLAETMERARHGQQLRIIDPAMPSKFPTAPNRLRLLLIAFALSLGAAVAGVTLAEYRDKSFHDIDDLRAFTRVPILVRIPAIETPGARRKKIAMAGLRTAASLVSLAAIVGVSYYLAYENEQLVWMLSESKPQAQAR